MQPDNHISSGTYAQRHKSRPRLSPSFRWVALSVFTSVAVSSAVAPSQGDVLRILNAERTDIMQDVGRVDIQGRGTRNTIVIRTTDAPLLAVNQMIAKVSDGVVVRETLADTTVARLKKRVAKRRLSLLRRTEDGHPAARPDIAIVKEVFPAYPSSVSVHSAAGVAWDLPIQAEEGQILMVRNGKPVWHDFPYLEQIRTSAPHGRESTTRAGGSRSGGSGNGPATSTTTIIQQTGGTSEPSGWTEGTGVVYLSDSTDSVGIGTNTPGTKLEVAGSISGASLYVTSSMSGAGLTDCDAGTNKLIYDATTGRFACATDQTVGVGLSQAAGDERYLQKQGGTMTGALTIRITNGTRNTIGLNIINTISGAVLHAEKSLTSSGTLVFEGAASGSSLYVASSLQGAGLTDCDIAGTSKLLWDATTGRFSCGTDTDTDTNTTYTAGRGLGLTGTSFSLNSTITGALVRFNTVSGSTIYAQTALNASGSLSVDGTAFLNAAAPIKITNAGFFGCTALETDSDGDLVCGTDTDTNTTYTAGQGLGLNGTTFSINSTLTGSLARFTTLSGSTVFASTALRSSGSLVWEGAASGASLWVSTLEGAGLTDCDASTSKVIWDATAKRFACSTDLNTGVTYTAGQNLTLTGNAFSLSTTVTGALVRFNTVSGSLMYAKTTLASSGTLVFEGAASGSSLYIASSIQGAGLTDCDTASSVLQWNDATGRFSCTTISAGTTYTAGQGLTLAGTSFSLNTTITGSLARFTTLSGSVVYGKNQLTSSGTLVTESGTYIDGTTFVVQAGNNRVGIGTAAPKAVLDVVGTVSGSSLTLSSLRNCDTIDTDANGNLICGADAGAAGGNEVGTMTFTGAVIRLADARYVKKQGDTMTGALVINVTGGNRNTVGLNVINAISGSLLHAQNSLTSSGTLVFEGAASGASLYVATSIQGAGLTDCDIAGSSKLLWDATTGRFSCGTDTDMNTTYTAGKGLALAGTSFATNDILTGSLIRFTTLSGSLVYAKNTLASSGSLTWEGAASGSSLYIASSIQGAGLVDCDIAGTSKLLWDASASRFSCGTDTDTDTNTTYTAGRGIGLNGTSFSLNSTITGALVQFNTLSGSLIYAKSTLASSGSLVFEGAGSGSSLYIASSLQGVGLTDCDIAGTSKLLWDATTGRFSCGSDQSGSSTPEVGTVSFSGAVLRLSDSRYVNTSGDTMTGALTINLTSGYIGLNVIQTASGSVFHAEKALTSSGQIIVKQFGISQGSGALTVTNVTRYGTGAYMAASGAILVLDSVGGTHGDARSPHILFGYQGNFDTNLYRSAALTLKTNGSFTVQNTMSGKTLFLSSLANIGSTESAVCVTATGAILKNGGTSTCLVSSLRFKHDVQDLPDSALATLAQMRPVSYKDNNTNTENLGFIAEEVEQIDPRLVFYEADGVTVRGVKYENFTALLAKGIQELDARVIGLENVATSSSGMVINSLATDGSTSLLTITSNVSSTGNTVLRVNAAGSIFSDGTYNSNGADYAEWFQTSSTIPLEPGEIVCIDILRNNAVKRCARGADPDVMGIVSTNPAFIGNALKGADGMKGAGAGYVLVGLIGQVPVTVNIDGGPIYPGDSLTSSVTPGMARRALAGESTVGVALEGYDGSSSFYTAEGRAYNIVNVLISRRNSSMTIDAVGQKVLDTIAAMEIHDEVQMMVSSALGTLDVTARISKEVEQQIAVLTEQHVYIETMNSDIASLKAQIAFLEDSEDSDGPEDPEENTSSGSSESSGSSGSFGHLAASTLELDSTLVTGGDARIGGDLHIDGTITINGTFDLASGATLNLGSGALTVDQLIAENALYVMGDITINGLATFLGDINIKGELTVSSKHAGFASIPESGTSVTVFFESAFKATPVVTASPDVPVLYGIRSTNTGFTVELAGPADHEITFSWIALGVLNPAILHADRTDDDTIIFPLDDKGTPVTSSMVWNACIRNITMFDESGHPFSCARYHDNYTWSHPDLQMTFLWNTSVTPALLKLPDGYEVQVIESAENILDAIRGPEDAEDSEDAEEPEDSEDPEDSEETGTGSMTGTGSEIGDQGSGATEIEPVMEEDNPENPAAGVPACGDECEEPEEATGPIEEEPAPAEESTPAEEAVQ